MRDDERRPAEEVGELGTAELRELRRLREGSRNLKQVVADLSLDKTVILQESLKRKS